MRKVAIATLLMAVALRLTGLDLAPPMEEYTTSSEFGFRDDPMGGSLDRLHGGVDLIGPKGATVMAAASGTVKEVWPPPNGYFKGHPVYGGMVLIQHDERTFTLYGHLSKVTVTEGWHVWAGRPIGVIGNTGTSTGTHLHFELISRPRIPRKLKLRKVDPIDRIMAKMVAAHLAHRFETWNVTR